MRQERAHLRPSASFGTTRGCGGTGVWDGTTLHVGRNYKTWKVLANGPIRAIFELSYDAWDAAGAKVSEVKRFTVDAGQTVAIAGPSGVGKSTIAANLALGLKANGLSVGVLDADGSGTRDVVALTPDSLRVFHNNGEGALTEGAALVPGGEGLATGRGTNAGERAGTMRAGTDREHAPARLCPSTPLLREREPSPAPSRPLPTPAHRRQSWTPCSFPGFPGFPGSGGFPAPGQRRRPRTAFGGRGPIRLRHGAGSGCRRPTLRECRSLALSVDRFDAPIEKPSVRFSLSPAAWAR